MQVEGDDEEDGEEVYEATGLTSSRLKSDG
jgi:hypothetical protein